MSFKENLKAKIRLDRIFQSLVSTVREPPGRRWLDNEAPRSKLRGILSGIAPKPYPPSLSRATARSPGNFIGPKPLAKADPLCSKLQSILAKANEGDLTHGFYFLNY